MTYNKPLPVAQPESDFYWESAKAGKLVVQKCSSCGEAQFFPRALCTGCGGRSMEWMEASGKATLFTFAIVHQPPHPGFVGETPYITAIVELAEGPKMPTQIVEVEAEPESLNIGMKLEVVFDAVTDEVSLPKFKPVA